MAFLVICCGITILQMSKIDPTVLKKLDRRSTILLQAARSTTEGLDEKDLASVEDPGIDSIRGSSGLVGSIIRAKSARRLSLSSRTSGSTIRPPKLPPGVIGLPSAPTDTRDGLTRHQLYDTPMPRQPTGSETGSTISTPAPPRTPTIKFVDRDVVHKYQPTKSGLAGATHESRDSSYLRTSPLNSPSRNISTLPVINDRTANDKLSLTSFPSSTSADPDSHGPRSAPLSGMDDLFSPTMSDPFEGIPATTTASTFRDSALEVRSSNERERWQRHSKRVPSHRNYPLTGGDDDREESMSLVDQPPSEDEYDPSNLGETGGIRLVPQSFPRR